MGDRLGTLGAVVTFALCYLICLCLIHFWVNPFFQFTAPAASSLWGNKKREPQYKDLKSGKILEQNLLNRLQMVQFECPKDRNPCVSFTFG